MSNFKRKEFAGTGRGIMHAEVLQMSKTELAASVPKEFKKFVATAKEGKKDPVFFAEELLGLRLHDGQKLWLWMTTGRQLGCAYRLGKEMGKWKDDAEFNAVVGEGNFLKNILVPSNRWGKTMVTAVKHLWINYYKIGAKGTPSQIMELRCGTLNLSPHSNQCQAAFDYILDILAGRFIYEYKGVSMVNKCRIINFYMSHADQRRVIMFSNNTFFKTVPTGEDQASSLAGMRFLYISYDEAPQSLHLKEELPAKIMSRLIDFGGSMDIIGTPEVDKPSHQYFHHIVKQGLKSEDGWWTLVGKLSDNIFLHEEEVKKVTDAIKSTDPAKYRQVVFGEFVTAGKKMFDSLVVERLWDRDKEELPIEGRRYVLSADWGFSDTGDPTVFYVVDYTDSPRYRICFRESIHGGSPFVVLARARILQRDWSGAKFIHDTASMGGTIIKKMLQEMNMMNMADFSYCGGQKTDMLFCMLTAMTDGRKTRYGEDGKIIDENPNFGRIRSYYIPELEEQLGNYQYNPEKGISDKRLEQNDVMSLGMAMWWLEKKNKSSGSKMVNFNPFAAETSQIFPREKGKEVGIRIITIPEKRIL